MSVSSGQWHGYNCISEVLFLCCMQRRSCSLREGGGASTHSCSTLTRLSPQRLAAGNVFVREDGLLCLQTERNILAQIQVFWHGDKKKKVKSGSRAF